MNPKFLVHLTLINSGWKATKIGDSPEGPVHRLPKADLYLDCRAIPNPFILRGSEDGDQAEVRKWVKKHALPFIEAFYTIITKSIDQIPSRRLGQEDPWAAPYVVCTMCAHGIHRSRAMKHILAEYLSLDGYTVEVK